VQRLPHVVVQVKLRSLHDVYGTSRRLVRTRPAPHRDTIA
jgi:hypothetical protein